MSASSFPLPEGKGTHANVAIGSSKDADVSAASVAVHLKNTVDALKADVKVPATYSTNHFPLYSNAIEGHLCARGGVRGGEEGAELGVHRQS